MPAYYFKEFWTPLSWAGIKFFRDDDGFLWIKWWSKPRKRLRRS